MEQIYLKAKDGYDLNLHIFAVTEAKAVVQIAHGMEEHQERYEDFISFLNKNGYSVVSADMRGGDSLMGDSWIFVGASGQPGRPNPAVYVCRTKIPMIHHFLLCPFSWF